MQLNGFYNLKTHKNKFLDNNDIFNSDEISINVLCDNKEKFYKEYINKDINLISEFNDLFLSIIYNKHTQELHIFSDITTSKYNLYYTLTDNKFFYSTSLKWLLINSKVERKLNTNAAQQFIKNGFVYGKETLIENVYKLDFRDEIIVKNKVEIKKCDYKLIKTNDDLIDTIQNSINKYNKLDTISMPLSGGYDSNLILNTLKNNKINAFTIGGTVGNNEIPLVKSNITSMNNVKLYTKIIDEKIYDSLADIVWRLDGSVYEKGIFMQYALANLASIHNAKDLICGECADEILNKNYNKNLNKVINNKISKTDKLTFMSDPFILTNLVVLKKSSIMLNSFNITGHYPFNNTKIAETSINYYKNNGLDKKYYKRECQKLFKYNLNKQDGATSNQCLMANNNYHKNVIDIYYNDMLNKVLVNNKHNKLSLKKILLRIYQIFKTKSKKELISKLNERRIDKNLKKIYLVIFNELYITGKYDNEFKNESIGKSTNEVLSKKEDLVSILMPIYNSEKWLSESIESVINQSYKNWELILVDDCSTDSSKDIAMKYAKLNSKIKYYRLDKNSGAAKARNKALEMSKGRFIAYLDADDLWKKDKLKLQVQFMKTYNYPFTCTSYYKINSKKEVLKKVNMPKVINYNKYLRNTIIQTVGVMIDTHEINKKYLVMPNIRRRNDAATWCQILKGKYNCYGIKTPLSYYRIVNKSLSSNKIKAANGTWNMYRKIEKLNILKSTYSFIGYALNAVRKRIYIRRKKYAELDDTFGNC